MRRFTVIIIIWTFSYIILYADLPVDFLVRSEYKNDTIDYSDVTKYYFRERVSVFFSQESLLNLSYIYLKKEMNKYTWNLILNDISPNVSFLIGNYFTDFGTGLLIGKKRIYEPDIFNIKYDDKETQYNRTFKPCNTGNPVFAFNGIAAAFNGKIPEIKFALNLFYSINERFADEDSYDSGKISSSMETFDKKTKDEYNHNEPLDIHAGGTMLSAEIMKIFLLQLYFINTSIRGHYKDQILWEYNSSNNTSNGILKLNGYGCFIQYKDEFLKFLIDGVTTQKVILLNDNKTKKVYGYGMLYALSFTPPVMSVALIRKKVTGTFYSPYSSSIGEDYPETAWFMDVQVKPFSNLKLQAQISSQKKNYPSSADDERPVTKKENLSLIYSYSNLEEFKVTFKKREKTNDKKEDKQQFMSSSKIAVINTLKVNLNAKFQQDESNNFSKTYLVGLRFLLTKYFICDISYFTAFISRDNPVYSVIDPVRDTSTQGIFIMQDSNIIVFKSDINTNRIFLSGRYLYQYHHKEFLSSRFEFYASCNF